MVAEPETLVLVDLRRLDEKKNRVIEDIRGLKVHATDVEGKSVRFGRSLAGVNRRLDRIEPCLDRTAMAH